MQGAAGMLELLKASADTAEFQIMPIMLTTYCNILVFQEIRHFFRMYRLYYRHAQT